MVWPAREKEIVWVPSVIRCFAGNWLCHKACPESVAFIVRATPVANRLLRKIVAVVIRCAKLRPVLWSHHRHEETA
jgi:hypothetical protein